MKDNFRTKNAYEKHSKYTTKKDNKFRKYFFIIDNLQEDYDILIKKISGYQNLKFDFVASCLYNDLPMLRIFGTNFTGRFSIDTNKISLVDIKNKLIEDGLIFAEICKKSGPLCLRNDFSETINTKLFRLFLPLREIYNSLKYEKFNLK